MFILGADSLNLFPRVDKGQLISKCPFSVFKSPKKPIEISALASKQRSNQKHSLPESK